jgi:hypothetical protein
MTLRLKVHVGEEATVFVRFRGEQQVLDFYEVLSILVIELLHFWPISALRLSQQHLRSSKRCLPRLCISRGKAWAGSI